MKIQRLITLLFLLTLALLACASVGLVTPAASGPTQSTEASSTPTVISPTTSTDNSPPYGSCGYVWAQQELPGLSQKINQSFQALDPGITGSAYAYGENCVYPDGHATFSAMETDFRVKVTIADLKDENALGDSISKVMGVIIDLPPSDLSGPQPGRVQFNFSKSETENLFLNVSIAKYQKLPAGLSGADLFRNFNNNP